MQKNLIDFLLTEMRARPAMYLQVNKISNLDAYLTGVQITCWSLDKDGKYSDTFFGDHGFLQWSWRKYGLGHPPYRLNHYLGKANGDDEQALATFFADLDEYLSESSR